ncbi:WYL domain-containing protein [Micromonospora sp. BRA006-A]|nr:WYL domain-containing protein [Micromonospora sp. BRA006-A]
MQARRDWPGSLLAERLRVSPRTVRRDVDRLRELGYPIESAKGPDGGYRLGAGSALPPLLFDDEQAVALTVALQTAAGGMTGIEEAAARALTTVRQVMPARLRHRVDALRVVDAQRAGTPARHRVEPALLMTLSAAVTPARSCASTTRRCPPRHRIGPAAAPVQPHHLVTWGGRWYLVAWDLDRDDWRTFRVDRISPRTPTGPRFTPRELPGGDVAAYVAGRSAGATGPGDWPCRAR